MKKSSFLGCFLTIWFLVSCTSQAAKIREPVLRPEVVESMMEHIISQVKQNTGDIKKYFILDENKEIIVKADLTETAAKKRRGETCHFEVIYDLKNLSAEGPSGFFIVPFTVKLHEMDEVRQDSLFWKPEKDATGILLTFDDEYKEVWEQNFDLFDRYGARVTFFLQGEYCSFSTRALERGHDVGYHSLKHLNLPKVSLKIFHEETTSALAAFRKAGVALNAFAYPFGLSAPWMHGVLLNYYKILRGYGVTFRVYDSAKIREGYISSRAIDNILFKKDEDFITTIDVMLRTVKFIGGDLILPLTTHDISQTADWGIKPHRLEYLLQSANDLGLKFYLFRDFISPANPQPGQERK